MDSNELFFTILLIMGIQALVQNNATILDFKLAPDFQVEVTGTL